MVHFELIFMSDMSQTFASLFSVNSVIPATIDEDTVIFPHAMNLSYLSNIDWA